MTILPPILHLRGIDQEADGWARLTSRRIVSELDSGRTGSTEVANRLADVLFLQTIRSYFDQNVETADAGWLAAVRDRQIGRALAAIHCNPRRPWTVPLLAHHLTMSRTAFASRFTELVGEPPQHYFTRLRINAAAVRLRTSRDKLTGVAAEAGIDLSPASCGPSRDTWVRRQGSTGTPETEARNARMIGMPAHTAWFIPVGVLQRRSMATT